MKTVYLLKEDLCNNPDRVRATQARTLDNRSLPGGLKGVYGLFGSEEWWRNIELGIVSITRLSGVVARVFREGMHNESMGFEMKMHDDSSFRWSCVATNRRDVKLYQVGKRINFVYATEPLKNPIEVPGGYETSTRITLEVAIEE